MASSSLLIAILVVGTVNVATAKGTTSPASSWTVYHGDYSGSGYTTVIKSVNTSKPKWTSPSLDGTLYGEPLVYGSDVYVATEHDTVYALSSATGQIVWKRHLASPVPSSMLPCGNILPELGVTGTPVIDPTRDEIYMVADELVHGHPEHVFVGLNASSGRPETTRNVDPPGSQSVALLQRTGLTLDGGRVIFGLGGNYGDCASYRGRVVSVSEKTGSVRYFTVDAASGDSQGAIWMGGGAPSIDAHGHVWVGAGNGSVYSSSDPYDDSDSVLELSSTMHLMQYFAPTDWAYNNSHDEDMSMEPVLLEGWPGRDRRKDTDHLRVERSPPRWHRCGRDQQELQLFPGRRRRWRRARFDGLPAVSRGNHRDPNRIDTAFHQNPLERVDGRRTTHHRGRAGLVDRTERRPLRLRPDVGSRSTPGDGGAGGQSFPNSERR